MSRGVGAIRCESCRRRFGGQFVFDRHTARVDAETRRCLSASELRARGFVRSVRGIWTQRYQPPGTRTTQPRLFRVGRWAKREVPVGPIPAQPGRRAEAANLTLFCGTVATALVLATALLAGTVFPTASADTRAARRFQGEAVYYRGSHGACTPHFTTYYAAHRTLPCWSQVRVNHNGRSVVVTIEDRGPYGHAVLDLAPAAFGRLAPLSAGRIWVHATVVRWGRG